jgi:small ligand-binding sensory domain FIST
MPATVAMKWASALSLQSDADAAVAEVLAEIKRGLAGAQPDAAFLFVSPHHHARYANLGARVAKELRPARVLGCSGGGVIGGGQEAERSAAVALTVAVLPGVHLTPFHIEDHQLPDQDASPRKWEEALGVKAESEPQFVVLADPFSLRAEEFIAGLDFAFPEAVKLGGLASAAGGPGQNALFLDQRCYHEGAVGLAFSGDVTVDVLLAQGCRPIGAPMRITQCRRNVLVELDKRPAVQVLGDLLAKADRQEQTLIRSSLFLGVAAQAPEADPPETLDFLIRNLMSMDAQRGTLTVGALLHEGQVVQFHVREAAAAHEALAVALRQYSTARMDAAGGEALPAPPRGALLFTCLGRGVHLYGQPNHDTRTIMGELGDLPIGGLFCAGEFGPAAGETHIHGFASCCGVFRPGS